MASTSSMTGSVYTKTDATNKSSLHGSRASLHSRDETEATTISGMDDDYSEYCDDLVEEEEQLDDLELELIGFAKRRLRRTLSANDVQPRDRGATGSSNDLKKMRRAVTLPTTSPQELEDRMAQAATTNGYYQDPQRQQNADPAEDSIRPDMFLQDTLRGVSAKTFESKTWEAYFTVVTDECIATHSLMVSRAIRQNDVDKLRQLHDEQEGMPLDSCNPQGESMMHLASRLGKVQVVKFLMEHANVSVRVRDDQGKTPLHDVCWSNKPNFDLVRYIVDQSPELLFIADYRNFTALHYVPTSCWRDWCDWIEANASWLRQKVQDSTWLKVQQDLDSAQARMQRLLAKAASAMEES